MRHTEENNSSPTTMLLRLMFFANCTSPVRDDGKNMSLSWEQSKQGPVKLYNNVLKIVTFVYKVASRKSFQHIV